MTEKIKHALAVLDDLRKQLVDSQIDGWAFVAVPTELTGPLVLAWAADGLSANDRLYAGVHKLTAYLDYYVSQQTHAEIKGGRISE